MNLKWMLMATMGVVLLVGGAIFCDHHKKTSAIANLGRDKEATDYLARCGAEVIPDVMGKLRSEDPAVREAAAAVLGRTKAGEAELAKLYAGDDAEARRLAALGMGRARAKPDGDFLLKAAGDKSPAVRAEAFKGLAALKDPKGVPAAVAALKDADGAVRAAALKALEKCAGKSSVGILAGVLQDESLSETARAILVKIADTSQIDPILPALKSGSPKVRLNAVELIHVLGGRNYAKDAAPLLADPDAEVRLEAFKTVAVSIDSGAIGQCIRLICDPDERISKLAVETISKFQLEQIADGLAEALPKVEPAVQLKAVEVVRTKGAATTSMAARLKGCRALVALLDARDPGVRAQASKALEEIAYAGQSDKDAWTAWLERKLQQLSLYEKAQAAYSETMAKVKPGVGADALHEAVERLKGVVAVYDEILAKDKGSSDRYTKFFEEKRTRVVRDKAQIQRSLPFDLRKNMPQ